MLLDTHIHLDFFPPGVAPLAEARSQGIGGWVVPGVAPQDWPRLMATVAATAGAWAAPGVHPLAADRWRPELADELRSLAGDARTVAIGEVGLDRTVAAAQTLQENVFRQMIRLAREAKRPLLLHIRQATGRVMELLRSERAFEVGGVAHAFSGSQETARQLIALGFALGIGGVVTYPGSRLAGVVQALPAEWLVLETDAPDLSPHPHRGMDNRPEWLTLVAERVAQLRGWTPAETAAMTTANARRVLRLPVGDKVLDS